MSSSAYNRKKEYLLNSENLYKSAIYLAWPVILQSLLQVSVGTVDIKMVGTLGVDAISAVGTSRNIIMILLVLVMGISTGTTAMVSRFIGSGDDRNASKSAGQAFILSLLLSAFIIPVGLAGNELSLRILGVGDSVLALAVDYMRIFFLAIPFFLLHFMAKSIFQGAGDTKTPLLIDIIMNLVNIGGNFLFIFGMFGFPAMGVAGAAVGTALSRIAGAAMGWGALLSGKYTIRVYLEDMLNPIWSAAGQIVRIGIPAALQGLSRNASTFILFAILARTSDASAAVPAFVIGTNLNQYALMPGLAIGTAAATLSGMNLGARKYDRAEASGKATAVLGAGTMLAISALFVVFARPFIGFFLDSPNEEVISIGTKYLAIIAASEPFHAVAIISSRTMQGAGFTKKPFQVTFFSWVVIRLILAYVLALVIDLDSTGVWIAISISSVISGVLAYGVFLRGEWKNVLIGPIAD
jgi:putative MATE family efflux protein